VQINCQFAHLGQPRWQVSSSELEVVQDTQTKRCFYLVNLILEPVSAELLPPSYSNFLLEGENFFILIPLLFRQISHRSVSSSSQLFLATAVGRFG
jgi:hypothetical protein